MKARPHAMHEPATPPLDESVLHALVDARVPPAEARALQAQLSPAQRAQLAQWCTQRLRLRELWPAEALEPTPAALQAAAERLQVRQDTLTSWWRWAGLGASWLLAFGLGWLARGA